MKIKGLTKLKIKLCLELVGNILLYLFIFFVLYFLITLLFEKVWKEKYFDSNNTVMVHIRRIREKLGEDTKRPKFIKTIWGVGYKIED